MAIYLIACFLLLAQVAAADNKPESIGDIQAMNLSNQTAQNRTAFNDTAFNSSGLNSPDLNSSKISSSKLSSQESNSSELNSSDLNSSKTSSSELSSLESNSSELNSSELNSSELESSNLSSEEITSTEFNSSDLAFADLGFTDSDYKYDSYSRVANETEAISLAFSATDLNADNATDLLVMNISSKSGSGEFNSNISAFSGADGSILWQKEYPGSLVFATSAGDLNGDGQTDIMIDEILSGASFIPYSSVSAIDGRSGTAIWSRPQMLAMTFAYPVDDINEDNASEFLVHVIGLDGMNNSMFTSIATVSGSNGTNLDERIFSGALAIEYPAGNLTADLLQDRIAAIYKLNESIMLESETAPMNITATTFQAIDGQERTALWNQSFSGPALALPVTDLTGDGLDDLVVYLMRFAGNDSMSCDIAALQGLDGKLLWQQSFAGLAFAVAGPDLTGEGQKDLLVYRMGESESATVQAVKGDDGRLLWSKTGMIFIPP